MTAQGTISATLCSDGEGGEAAEGKKLCLETGLGSVLLGWREVGLAEE